MNNKIEENKHIGTEKTTAEKVAIVVTIAATLIIANWLADKIVGNRPEFKA